MDPLAETDKHTKGDAHTPPSNVAHFKVSSFQRPRTSTMAGTRLCIQGLALLELVALTLWSFYHGFCRQGDVLCTQRFWHASDPQFQLPPSLLEAPLLELPWVQVDKQLHPDTGLKWKKNPNTVIVCSQPESPVVQSQIFWWCPPPPPSIHPEDSPRAVMVVRQSSMVLFSKQQTQLRALALPEVVSPPFLLTVHLVLEQQSSEDLASEAQRVAVSLNDEITRLQDWPCVNAVEIQMTVVEPYTEKWILAEPASEGSDDERPPPRYLPKVTDEQAAEILDQLDLSAGGGGGQELILYFPALVPDEKSTFRVGNNGTQLFIVGGFDASSVNQWLLSKLGIQTHGLDTDGSFPTWFEEWYWYSAIQVLSKQVMELFSRTKHLLEAPLELEPSLSLKENYGALKKLHMELELVLTKKTIHTDFPIEHYAAIFAPLLFPLLLPFLAGVIKELRRYKEKKRTKSENEHKKSKMD